VSLSLHSELTIKHEDYDPWTAKYGDGLSADGDSA
jgi:hypothetical protein